MRKVLNVGGNSKDVAIPAHYAGWQNVVLDIDPTNNPDVVCDARNLESRPPGEFDAIYCSHNLEHYWRHDLPDVLAGFIHVLRGDIDEPVYVSPAGPITTNDIVYGYGPEIEESGNDFYAQKNGFTDRSLHHALRAAGFEACLHRLRKLEVSALAFRREPSEEQRKLLLA